MSIIINQTFPGSTLRKSTSYKSQILATPGLVGWWKSGVGESAASGHLASWTDVVSGAVAGNTSGSGNRPSIVTGAANGYNGYLYDGVSQRASFPMTGDGVFAGDFTIVSIFTAPFQSGSDDAFLLSTYSGGNIGTMLWTRASTGMLYFKHGAGQTQAAFTPNTLSIAIFGHSAQTIAGRLNGVTATRVGSDDAHGTGTWLLSGALAQTGSSAVATPCIKTDVELMIFNTDVLWNQATVDLLERYAADPRVYGVTLANS